MALYDNLERYGDPPGVPPGKNPFAGMDAHSPIRYEGQDDAPLLPPMAFARNPYGIKPPEDFGTVAFLPRKEQKLLDIPVRELDQKVTPSDDKRIYTEPDRGELNIYGTKEKKPLFQNTKMDVPAFYRMAGWKNIVGAVGDSLEQSPGYLGFERVGLPRVRHNDVPFQAAGKNIKEGAQQALSLAKGQTRSVGDFLKMVNAVTSQQVQGQNQLAVARSDAMQKIDLANAQIAAQEESANVEIGQKERLYNTERKQQHAQMKKKAINDNVNAAILSFAQAADYETKQKAAQQKAATDAIAVEYMMLDKRYDEAQTSPELDQYLLDEADKVVENIYGEIGRPGEGYDNEFMKGYKEKAVEEYQKNEVGRGYYDAYLSKKDILDQALASETKTQEEYDTEMISLNEELESSREKDLERALADNGAIANELEDIYRLSLKSKFSEQFDKEKATEQYFIDRNIEKPDMSSAMDKIRAIYEIE